MFERRRAAVVAVLAGALLWSGCSMLFMRRPPKGEGPVAAGDCTRSQAAPVIDGVVGVGHLGQAAGIWGASRDEFDSDEQYDGYLIGSAILSGAFVASTIHGFVWSEDCRSRNTLSEQAIRDHLRVLASQQRSDR
ncbi:hypothetical protein [Candidatus Palauibacter sp.]|uniref:hypothetical protein n=1 Tax=Candidatus Palauibacter sp. TaxID=3101350 RepID=UPI003D1509EE